MAGQAADLAKLGDERHVGHGAQATAAAGAPAFRPHSEAQGDRGQAIDSDREGCFDILLLVAERVSADEGASGGELVSCDQRARCACGFAEAVAALEVLDIARCQRGERRAPGHGPTLLRGSRAVFAQAGVRPRCACGQTRVAVKSLRMAIEPQRALKVRPRREWLGLVLALVCEPQLRVGLAGDPERSAGSPALQAAKRRKRVARALRLVDAGAP